jgi:hypothetical protein
MKFINYLKLLNIFLIKILYIINNITNIKNNYYIFLKCDILSIYKNYMWINLNTIYYNHIVWYVFMIWRIKINYLLLQINQKKISLINDVFERVFPTNCHWNVIQINKIKNIYMYQINVIFWKKIYIWLCTSLKVL